MRSALACLSWLAPYMTGRDPAQTFAVTPSVWYREVIADDKPIPPPTPAR